MASSKAPRSSHWTPSWNLAELKKSGKCKKLVVTGCLVQRHPVELARELPEVDHFLGTGAYAEVARIVSDAQSKRVVVPDPDFVHSASTPRVNSLPSHTAYLKISEGCDHDCAFCIIPKLRGPQRSRPRGGLGRRGEHRSQPKARSSSRSLPRT